MDLASSLLSTVHIPTYEDIREDLLRFMGTIYDVPEIQDSLIWEDSKIRDEAISEYYDAASYDPHEPLHQSVSLVQSALRSLLFKIGVMYILTAVLSFVLPFSAFLLVNEFIFHIFDRISTIATLSFLPTSILIILTVYWYSLASNTKVVQGLNEELRIGPARINKSRRDGKLLFSYYAWNSIIRSQRTHIVLAVLYIVKSISQGLYEFIFKLLTSNAESFVNSDGITDIISTLFRDVVSRK